MAVLAERHMSKSKPTPRDEWAKGKPLVIQVRGSEEFKAWAERLAKHSRMSVAQVVEQALIAYARNNDFKDVAPER